jgi:D-cysteine desulfhydrase
MPEPSPTSSRPRLRLVHGPTPLLSLPRLSSRLGVDLWIKRDDATGGAEAGNKLRKLEWLVADALAQGADTLLTCGAVQSNHCRATALIAARFGLGCRLLLRTEDVTKAPKLIGNYQLSRMAGAETVLVTYAQYAARAELLVEHAQRLRAKGKQPYIIPEGASNALGSLGYVEAMREVRTQLDAGLAGGAPFDVIVHACGSGGTAAGIAAGAGRYGVAKQVRAMAVCDDRATFEGITGRILDELRQLEPSMASVEPAKLVIDDAAKGPRYGVPSVEQARFVEEMARSFGLVLDPVYTGKALFGLARAIAHEPALLGRRVLFVHTGGLPGLLAEGEALEAIR